MKPLFVVLLCLFYFLSSGQRVVIYTDSAHQHGYKIFDGNYDRHGYSRTEMNKVIDSVNASTPGWRLPTVKEMQEIYTASFDKRTRRSSVSTSVCCTSELLISDLGGKPDTVNIVGNMYARQFQSGPPNSSFDQPITYRFFLIKDL